eukprot:m.130639 g.130639  ORF g.130639 m.130639 type:complete len:109 (-) comp9791_c0_seq3:981-1307(-)
MKARDKRKSFGLTEGALLEGGNRVSFSKLVVQQFVDPCPAQFELVLEIWPLPGAGQIVDYIVPLDIEIVAHRFGQPGYMRDTLGVFGNNSIKLSNETGFSAYLGRLSC